MTAKKPLNEKLLPSQSKSLQNQPQVMHGDDTVMDTSVIVDSTCSRPSRASKIAARSRLSQTADQLKILAAENGFEDADSASDEDGNFENEHPSSTDEDERLDESETDHSSEAMNESDLSDVLPDIGVKRRKIVDSAGSINAVSKKKSAIFKGDKMSKMGKKRREELKRTSIPIRSDVFFDEAQKPRILQNMADECSVWLKSIAVSHFIENTCILQ